MSREDWGSLSARLGPQLPPVRPGQFAPKVEEPKCSRCQRRRKVGRVTRTEIICATCLELSAEYSDSADQDAENAL